MTSTTNHTKINKLYDYIAKEYEKTLQYEVQRFSNNKHPKFTDVQAMENPARVDPVRQVKLPP